MPDALHYILERKEQGILDPSTSSLSDNEESSPDIFNPMDPSALDEQYSDYSISSLIPDWLQSDSSESDTPSLLDVKKKLDNQLSAIIENENLCPSEQSPLDIDKNFDNIWETIKPALLPFCKMEKPIAPDNYSDKHQPSLSISDSFEKSVHGLNDIESEDNPPIPPKTVNLNPQPKLSKKKKK